MSLGYFRAITGVKITRNECWHGWSSDRLSFDDCGQLALNESQWGTSGGWISNILPSSFVTHLITFKLGNERDRWQITNTLSRSTREIPCISQTYRQKNVAFTVVFLFEEENSDRCKKLSKMIWLHHSHTYNSNRYKVTRWKLPYSSFCKKIKLNGQIHSHQFY